jgi:hypothetical protein
MFLAIRMSVYIAAVPVAAWLGGTYDPASHVITLNVDTLIDVIGGLAAAGIAFATSRYAKLRGGAT